MGGFKHFQGVYASDTIQNAQISNTQPSAMIMNLDDSSGTGTHWVAVYIDPVKSRSVEYVDSFGDPPSAAVRAHLQSMIDSLDLPYKLLLKVNGVIHQKETTDTCGYMAGLFLTKRMKGESFKEATGYDDPDKDTTEESEKEANKFRNKYGYM